MSELMQQVEVLRAACCVAGADGEISDSERAALKGMAERLGVGKASLDAMMDLAVKDELFRAGQLKMLHADPEKTFATLVRVARVEPDVPGEERDTLLHFGRRLGLSDDQMRTIAKSTAGRGAD